MVSPELKISLQTPSTSDDLVALYDLRGHQVKALHKLANGKILWGGVGTGKSRVAAAYYAINEAPRDVIVITTAKKRDSFDWQEEFYRIGIGPKSGPSVGTRSVRKPAINAGTQRDNKLGTRSGSAASLGSRGSNSRVDGGSVRLDDNPLHLQREELQDSYRGHTPDHGDVQGGSFDQAGAYPWVLTVDSWNNISKYADVAGAFFIFDEQRLVGSGDWTRKFLRIAKRNHWILLSGTPGDTWMDYIPVFVANNFYKNRTAFKREHVVYNSFTKFPKVDHYINVGKLARHRANLLVEMPYERHTKREIVELKLDYDKELLDRVLKDRWNIYTNKPLRDVAEMFSVGRKLVNSDPSRLEMIKELWMRHPKLIVFYNFNYELEILRSLAGWQGLSERSLENNLSITSDRRSMTGNGILLPAGMSETPTGSKENFVKRSIDTGKNKRNFQNTVELEEFATSSGLMSGSPAMSLSSNKMVSGRSTKSMGSRHLSLPVRSGQPYGQIAEWNGHKHEAIPTGTRWLYLVQYTAGAEGWNCIETDAMCFYSRNYSWKVFEQSCGRIDRLNTPFSILRYYDLASDSFIDKAIGRSLKAKQNFNEAKYARLFKG